MTDFSPNRYKEQAIDSNNLVNCWSFLCEWKYFKRKR